jgi:antitoxin component YwqK of YwqJK toxin-antitoxin module
MLKPIIMKKSILVSIAFLFTVVSFAQDKRDLKLNKNTNLIEVVYYHDNGVVSQTGAYTTDGKLQGEWLSFDTAGKKQVSASYDNGKKVGKWFYWNDTTLKEVDYTNNKIANVSEWEVKNPVATSN